MDRGKGEPSFIALKRLGAADWANCIFAND